MIRHIPIVRAIYNRIGIVKNIKKQIQKQSAYNVQFYNCWEQKNDEMYWQQFLQSHNLLDNSNKRVAIFSVFGPRSIISKVNSDMKIFYSAENLERFPSYLGYCLDEPSIDLAMGFDYLINDRYIRFPLWMDYMFPAESTVDDIRRLCAQIRYPEIGDREKFCCMVASNSADGLRDEMLDTISNISKVDSAGKYRHNDNTLQTECGDDKCKYLRRYIFNICPENSSVKGYVSEKLFEAFREGCIPIYWGSEGYVEPDVVNKEAFIYWDRENCGNNAIKKIAELYNNQNLLNEFLRQPRLLPTAEEFILDTYSDIEKKLRQIMCR